MSQLYDICRVVSRRISHFLSMKANTNVHGNYSLRPFFKKKKKKKKKGATCRDISKTFDYFNHDLLITTSILSKHASSTTVLISLTSYLSSRM